MTTGEINHYVWTLYREGNQQYAESLYANVKLEGWRKMQRAWRIVRRLNLSEALVKL